MSKPKPIVDPHKGQYQVVVSFRVPAFEKVTVTQYRDVLERWLRRMLPDTPAALYVTAYEIGAQGSASEHEGMVGLTEDEVVWRTGREVENVDPGGKL